MNLREQALKLAHEKPELRRHLLPLIKEARVGNWWVANIMGGRIFFEASSNSHAFTIVKKWLEKSGIGMLKSPKITKANPKDINMESFRNKSIFTHDKQLGVYVEM